MTRLTITLVFALVLAPVLTPALAAGPASATTATTQTCDELIDTLHGFENASAFQDYSEFAVLRSQAITSAQVGTCSAEKRERLGIVVGVLESFTSAHQAAQNDSLERAFEHATRAEENVTALREQGSTEYAALASLALERFYRTLGARMADRARSASRTPDEIQRLEFAVTAYRRAGVTDRYSKLTVRIQSLSASYERDMTVVNGTVSDTRTFLQSCTACDSPLAAATNPIEAVGSYQQAQTLQSRLGDAETRLESHGLDPAETSVADLSERTTGALQALAIGSAIVLGVFSLLVAVLSGVLAWRIGAWKRDLDASRVDEIVLAEAVGQ